MIDVSVVMITYFSEKTVAKAIDSVLMQKTSYSYEIVISDDASGDNTQNIIREYEQKYPDIVKLHVNKENVGLSMNNYLARCNCKGRYIAVLDGDDYWIDDQKIQWQVDYLEKNRDIFAVACTVCGRYDEEDATFARYPVRKNRDKVFTLDFYLKGNFFGTNGMMMRNVFLTEEGKERFSLIHKASKYIDDATECILVLQEGNVFVSSRESTVYRVPRKKKGSNNFNSINSTKQKLLKQFDLYNYLYDHLSPKEDLFYLYVMNLSVAYADCLRRLDLPDMKVFSGMIPEEYKERGAIFKGCCGVFKVSLQAVARKLFVRSFR